MSLCYPFTAYEFLLSVSFIRVSLAPKDYMFYESHMNQPIGDWDVSRVTSMVRRLKVAFVRLTSVCSDQLI